MRERIVEHGGEVIKQTGDGFFASFDNPKGAIEAAVAIQRAHDAEIVAPEVRIGAHTGGAFRTDADTTDYGGQGVRDARRHRERFSALRATRAGFEGLREAG